MLVIGDRVFRRCKSASIHSLPVGDKLDRIVYESGNLARAVSHETTTFLSNEGQFNPDCWYVFTFFGSSGFIGLAMNIIIILLTDQRGKPFQDAKSLIFWGRLLEARLA